MKRRKTSARRRTTRTSRDLAMEAGARFSRDVAIELKKAEAALREAAR